MVNPDYQSAFDTYKSLISCDKNFFLKLNDKELLTCQKIADYFLDKRDKPTDYYDSSKRIPLLASLSDMQAIDKKIKEYKSGEISAPNTIDEVVAVTIYQIFHPEAPSLPPDIQTDILSNVGSVAETKNVSKEWHDIIKPKYSLEDSPENRIKKDRKDQVWRGVAKQIGCAHITAEPGMLNEKIKEYCITYIGEIKKLPEASPDVKQLCEGEPTIEKMLQLIQWRTARDRMIVWQRLAIAIQQPSPDMANCHTFGGMIEKANEFSAWFESNLKKLSMLQELYLDGNQLAALPPEIGRLSSLQTLYLNGNQLTALPPEIGRLSSLQTLYLYANQLTALPPEIGRLSSLQTLYLNGNQLTALPPEIGRLSLLQTLYLNDNQLTALPPEIGRLSLLQTLYLNGNQLTALPPEIGRLSSLQTLYLNGNQLTALPPEIGRLSSLQELYLNRNQLTALPPEIGRLSSLQGLYLNGNQLTALPPEIGGLRHQGGGIYTRL